MQITYKNLWILCAKNEISKSELRKQTGLSPATFTKLRRNQEVSLTVLIKISQALKCNIGDIVDMVEPNIIGENEDAQIHAR